MATVFPFRGLRFNAADINNLADVITPPYDVIDSDNQNRYYQKHPYNIIRLEYGKTYPDDNESNNRYTRAAADYSSWLRKNILTMEDKPSFYLYEQEFTVEGLRKIRTGFICAVKLEKYEKGIVLPHEETLPKHKADRLALMRACRANFSPIFGLYSDPDSAVTTTLREVASSTPHVSFSDENGGYHRLWVISDNRIIKKVQSHMNDKCIFIADGHHRYETCLNYKTERDKEYSQADGGNDRAYGHVMMTLINLHDPGLVVLPTHRLIRNVEKKYIEYLPERLLENFSLEEFKIGQDKKNMKYFLDRLAELGKDHSGKNLHRHVFGMYIDKKLFIAAIKNINNLAGLMRPDKSPAWQGLDVSVLHSLVIEKYLGIGEELRAKGDHITYTREEEGAMQAVDRGEYQAAFFLNPTLVEEVTSVAANGEKMPQKSTFFYPKLITGLVLKSLE